MRVSKTELIRIFTDISRKGLTDGMFRTLIDSLWRNNPPQKIFEFTDSAAPAIEDYDTEYADVFGQYPKFVLLIADGDGNELESQHVPVRYRTDGLLTRIAWDLGEQFSGKIIMYK